jgi:hypothetical protein
MISALDASGGKEIWSAGSGAPILDPYCNGGKHKAPTGLGVGEGCLIVPSSKVKRKIPSMLTASAPSLEIIKDGAEAVSIDYWRSRRTLPVALSFQ